jgi:hypothetical protein
MKKTFFIIGLFIFFNTWVKVSYSQPFLPVDSSNQKWSAELTYWNAFTAHGYVQVGEFQYTGDKLYLSRDLGINRLISPGIIISRHYRGSSSFLFSAERFFFSGHKILDRNIFYNGALIKGTDGLSINQTWYYRFKLSFEKSFHSSDNFYPTFIAGVIYDGLTFYVNGTLLPGYGKEQHEDFVTQALPYPFAGARVNKLLSPKSSLSFEMNGMYIPLFKSFFNEGGSIFLKYSTAEASLHYWFKQKRFKIGAAYLWRLVKLYEYSAEDDPNDFFLTTSGIQLNLRYDFPSKK